jgi:hypothetical protein
MVMDESLFNLLANKYNETKSTAFIVSGEDFMSMRVFPDYNGEYWLPEMAYADQRMPPIKVLPSSFLAKGEIQTPKVIKSFDLTHVSISQNGIGLRMANVKYGSEG